ncbi:MULTISPECIES: DUF302 domain-containing protein [unclassified Halomonas]|uniref:DUF302 domain-containing protein n=1 Tax=unclassified Halomonas TaxID=2609666 RepID=UPI0006DB2A06|nr:MULTISPECIES: DUF302 domain-containing protein [unclassified Halomonas]KPQ21644.1 MAG: hypothetical protein HLUCCO06_13765 [Halomonas sp. HL-93]SBR46670.1 protein of unknown function DUF302 [Halomonas sp. HL-93]SNY98858.1 protein of unknown function DUF302 [Halomonas sp. hl-4]
MRISALIGMAAVGGVLSQPLFAAGDKGIEHLMSDTDFDTVIEQLNDALDDKGLNVMATVDHAENAANNDLELPPTTTFIFGNPQAGTPMMQCQGSVALDLPQKMVVRETDDGVRLEWNDPHYLAERHGLTECDLPLDNVAGVLREVAESAAQ